MSNGEISRKFDKIDLTDWHGIETVRNLNNFFLSSPFWVLPLAYAFLSQYLSH